MNPLRKHHSRTKKSASNKKSKTNTTANGSSPITSNHSTPTFSPSVMNELNAKILGSNERRGSTRTPTPPGGSRRGSRRSSLSNRGVPPPPPKTKSVDKAESIRRMESTNSNPSRVTRSSQQSQQSEQSTSKYRVLPSGKKVYTETRHRRTRSGNDNDTPQKGKKKKTGSTNRKDGKDKKDWKDRKEKKRNDSVSDAPNLLPSQAKKVKRKIMKRRMSQTNINVNINAQNLKIDINTNLNDNNKNKYKNKNNDRNIQSARRSTTDQSKFSFGFRSNKHSTPTINSINRSKNKNKSNTNNNIIKNKNHKSSMSSHSLNLNSNQYPNQNAFDMRELKLKIESRSMRNVHSRTTAASGTIAATSMSTRGVTTTTDNGRNNRIFTFGGQNSHSHSRRSSDTKLLIGGTKEDILENIAFMRKFRPPPSIETSLSKNNRLKKLKLRNLPDIPILIEIISVSTSRITTFKHSIPKNLQLKDICRKFSYENPRFIFNKCLKDAQTSIESLSDTIENTCNKNEKYPLIVFNIKNKDKSFELSDLQVKIIRLQAILGYPALVARFLLQLLSHGNMTTADRNVWNELLPNYTNFYIENGIKTVDLAQKIVRNHKKLGSEINSVHDHNHSSKSKSTSKSKSKSKHSELKPHGSHHRPKLSDVLGDLKPLTKDTQTLSSKYIVASHLNNEINIMVNIESPYQTNNFNIVINVYDTIGKIKEKIQKKKLWKCQYLLLFAPTKVFSVISKKSQSKTNTKTKSKENNASKKIRGKDFGSVDIESIDDPSKMPIVDKQRLSTSAASLQFDFDGINNNDENQTKNGFKEELLAQQKEEKRKEKDKKSKKMKKIDFDNIVTRKESNSLPGAKFMNRLIHTPKRNNFHKNSFFGSSSNNNNSNNSNNNGIDFNSIETRSSSKSYSIPNAYTHKNQSSKDEEFFKLQEKLEEILSGYKADGIDFVQLRNDSCMIADLKIYYEKNKNKNDKDSRNDNATKCNFKTHMYAIPLSKNPRNMTTVEINEIHEWCLGRSKFMLRKFSPNIADAGYINNSINSVNINQIDRKRSTSQKISSRGNINISINRSAKTMISKDKGKDDDEKNGLEVEDNEIITIRRSTDGALFELTVYFESINGEYRKLFTSDSMTVNEFISQVKAVKQDYYYSPTLDVYLYNSKLGQESSKPLMPDRMLSECINLFRKDTDTDTDAESQSGDNKNNKKDLVVIVKRSKHVHTKQQLDKPLHIRKMSGKSKTPDVIYSGYNNNNEDTILGKMKRLGSVRGSRKNSSNQDIDASMNGDNKQKHKPRLSLKSTSKLSLSLSSLSKANVVGMRSKSQPRNKDHTDNKDTKDNQLQLQKREHNTLNKSSNINDNNGNSHVNQNKSKGSIDETESDNEEIDIESESVESSDDNDDDDEDDEKNNWDPRVPLPPKPKASSLVKKRTQHSITSKIIYRSDDSRSPPLKSVHVSNISNVNNMSESKLNSNDSNDSFQTQSKPIVNDDATLPGVPKIRLRSKNQDELRNARRKNKQGKKKDKIDDNKRYVARKANNHSIHDGDKSKSKSKNENNNSNVSGRSGYGRTVKITRRSTMNDTVNGSNTTGRSSTGHGNTATREEISKLTRYKGSHDRAYNQMKMIDKKRNANRSSQRRAIDLTHEMQKRTANEK